MNILFITNFPPFPIDRSGGSIRSRLLLNSLGACGKVKILYLNYRGPAHDLAGELGALPAEQALEVERSILVPAVAPGRFMHLFEKLLRGIGLMLGTGMIGAGLRVSKEAEAVVSDLISREEVDLIVGRFTRAAAVAGIFNGNYPIPIIIDADDWDPSRVRTRITELSRRNIFKRLYWKRHLKGSEYLGEQAIARADHIWVASQTDTALISRSHASTLPNLSVGNRGEAIVPLSASDKASHILFAVGQWGNPQNRDGMHWFLSRVWPRILEQVPSAQIRLAGLLSDDLSAQWTVVPNVRLLGFVDDLRAEYQAAALALTPITWGGGTKIKVLEALAYGRVPVGPEHAFDGLAAPIGEGAIGLVENDPARLASAIIELLECPDKRFAREREAVKFYQKNYDVEAFNSHVVNTVETVFKRNQ